LRADKIQVEQVAANVAEKTDIIQSLKELDLSRANIASFKAKPDSYSDEIIELRSLPAPAWDNGYPPPPEKKATHRRWRRSYPPPPILPTVAGEESACHRQS
jgi:hypothetical protein